MALQVHRSNRIELLAGRLAEVVAAPLSDPFARECIVVQGPGMERWLSAHLARALGVWANPWFPFPRALIELLLEAALGPAPEEAQRFHPDALIWLIARQLPQHLHDPAFSEVAAYLGGDRHHERLIELSRRLAETLDQYVIYRPDVLLRWEQGHGEEFQAKLLRALVAGGRASHLGHRIQKLKRALAAGRSLRTGARALPERVCLFGISTLPPVFVELLTIAAQQLDVHLFLLTPSQEYWGDLDRSQRARGDLHGLLAQLGKVSREFVDQLEQLPYEEGSEPLFEAPGYGTMLHALQSDLVELTARSRHRAELERPLPVSSEGDDSIRVHVCHSIVRELEVLRDELRARFERDATLEPRDVIVFTPDIERYAPAIEAVFAEGAMRDARSIPFRIADRKAVRASEVADAFFALLGLIESRLGLSDVLDFLHRECVRSRFEIAEAELDRVQHWLVESGARWAIDGAHRSSFAQPSFIENSLRFALDRLLVGFACRDGEERELFGSLPYSDVEGRDALLLGKVARYLETLFEAVRTLSTVRPPAEHVKTLAELLDRVLSDEGELGIEHHTLRAVLADLAGEIERSGFDSEVGLGSVRKVLERRLDRGRANVGFLAGGVTFCEPVPMRSIPFRVIALLGMDDESFPRSIARPAFDLMAREPRPGDRTLRDDDRQLFLETILSARDALHVSYVGRSAQDDTERPASVLVDQLLRLCDQHFVLAGAERTLSFAFEGPVSESLRREHALHRFDLRYFQGTAGKLFSYDPTAAAAARSLLSPKSPPAPFARTPLAALGPADLSLDQLARFFRKPQQTFVRDRLKIFLPRELDAIDDREPIAFEALERYRLADDLLNQRVRLSRDERARLLFKSGRLAPGSIGRAQLEQLEQLVDCVMEACPDGTVLPDRDFSLVLPSGRLFGRLTCLSEEARVLRSVGTLHVKRRLGAFIEHLALCATGNAPRITRLVGRDGKKDVELIEFAPVDDARELLDLLLQLYTIGSCMPLPLVHEASEAFAKERARGADEATALARAQLKLAYTRSQAQSALEDAHLKQVWTPEELGHPAELWASNGERTVSFAEVAEHVLGPLLRASTGQGER